MNQVKPIIVQQGLGKFNPFKPKCGSWKIYSVLAETKKPLLVETIAKQSKVPLEKTKNILSAFRNAKHGIPLRRARIALVGDATNGFALNKEKGPQEVPDNKRRPGEVQPIFVQSIAPSDNTSTAWGRGWRFGFYDSNKDIRCPYPKDIKEGLALARAWQYGLSAGIQAKDQYSEWLNGQENAEEEEAEAA